MIKKVYIISNRAYTINLTFFLRSEIVYFLKILSQHIVISYWKFRRRLYGSLGNGFARERVMPFCTLFFKGRGRELNILSIYTMTWYICMYVPSVVCNSTEVYIHIYKHPFCLCGTSSRIVKTWLRSRTLMFLTTFLKIWHGSLVFV